MKSCRIATFGNYVITDYAIFVGWMSIVLILTWMWPGYPEGEAYQVKKIGSIE